MAGPHARNTVRVMISMLPADLRDLDVLAVRLAEPGLAPNRSAALRHALREYLNLEADRGREPGSRRRAAGD